MHPGLLHNADDLRFVRDKVAAGEQPWRGAWDLMLKDSVSSMNWKPAPVEHVTRGVNDNPDIGAGAMMRDSAAAYGQALQWAVTDDPKHAKLAIAILDAWSEKLKTIEGHDAQLIAGLTAYKFCNAAEIIRYSNAGWGADKITQFQGMLLNVFCPLMHDFYPKANGNWDASMINSSLSIAVFCDDHAIFDRTTDYFLHGAGNGAIDHYVFPSGQCQESTRDQFHTQLGLGMLADACEIAWKQGVDLYGASNNRLAAGFEYTAKYNLGLDVPCKGKISSLGRGTFRPIFEKAYFHYAIEKKLPMPFTRQVLEKTRPEPWHRDHESWETLTFFRKVANDSDR